MPLPQTLDQRFPLKQVITDYSSWPINQLTLHAEEFLSEVIDETHGSISGSKADAAALREMLASTLYHEKIRLSRKPWSVDPPDEKTFWRNVEQSLAHLNGQTSQGQEALILEEIVERYAREILGTFRIPTYKFARQFLPIGFNRLLNASSNKNFSRLFGNRLGIHDRVKLTGSIEHYRKLVADGGTLVMVPTHFSNLDSILIGYSIDAIGLPAFTYGAGLNLFSARILAYFMNRLGAYKVDRRKKNRIYLETLKQYSTMAMMRGCHMLFFPGGTRSRYGGIEKSLKLGLMGTVTETQRRLIQQAGENGSYRKIYIVPVIQSYHFVLEAPALIRDHLKQVGRERFFVEQDKFSSSSKIARFLLRFFTAGSDIWVNYAPPLDILGNPVDENGRSLDQHGNEVSLRSYFKNNGRLVEDAQRDAQYTKILADRVLDSFYRYNIVLSSHVVSFTAFRLLEKRFPSFDLYERLRLSEDERKWPKEEFERACARTLNALKAKSAAGEVHLEPILEQPVHEVVEHGLRNLGIYHDRKALKFSKDKKWVQSEDLQLLYFYHNRLEGYGLEKFI
jgi:glycerol-3-phosphate O-acyltransferase